MNQPPRDPLAIGLGALGSGIGFGGGAITLAQIAVAVMQRVMDASAYERIAPDPLLGGLLIGVGVAAVVGWRGCRALENLWQSGVIGVLSAVGALLIGFLAAPIDHFFGFLAMVAWFALTLALGVAGRRWGLRGQGGQDATP